MCEAVRGGVAAHDGAAASAASVAAVTRTLDTLFAAALGRRMICDDSTRRRSRAGHMRLLIVEDNPALGRSIESVFRAKGYAVDLLDAGDDADTALRTQDY